MSLDSKLSRPGLPELFLALIVGAVFWTRWFMLSQTGFANGLDGYYYALQIKSLQEVGHLMIADPSPLYGLLVGLNLLVGDPVKTTKLAAAFASAVLVLGAGFWVGRAGGGRVRMVWAALLLGLSPTLTVLSVDYLKNLAALAALLPAVALASPGPVGQRRPWTSWALAVGLVLFAIALHRVTAVLVVVWLVATWGPLWWRRARLGWWWLAVAAGLAGGLVVWLSGVRLTDLDRFLPGWAPLAPLPAWAPVYQRLLPPAVVWEISLAAVLAWGLPGVGRGAALLLLPVWSAASLDPGFRLYANALPLVGLAVARLWPWTGRRTLVVAVALALASLPLVARQYELRRDPPWALYDAVIRPIHLPADSLVIAHQGLNHYYSYKQELREALNFLPEFKLPVDRLWRLALGTSAAEIRAVLASASLSAPVSDLAGGYCLVREDVWQSFLAASPDQRRAELATWFNPHEPRPSFLLERNRQAARDREARFQNLSAEQ